MAPEHLRWFSTRAARFRYSAVIAAAIGVLFASAGPILAQPAGDYLRLIDRYIEDADAAIRTLASWSRAAITDGVDACVRVTTQSPAAAVCSTQEKVAAAMLHSDTATSIINSNPERATFHIQIAGRLLDHVQDRPLFVQRWYEFIAMLYVSGGRFQEAAAVVNEALRKYPSAATLYAVRGAVAELRVAFDHPNMQGEVITDDRTNSRVTRTLEAAAADYRRALDLDPRFVTARLRLGWIHLLLRDGRAARDLSMVLQDTTDDSIRYLAHLFVGAIAEREERLADALREYQAARQVGAPYQTACVALSHVEDALGHSARARATALECVALKKADDPWWRLGPFDPRTLDWLHAEARAR
jgi:tetratricopeptide (TPR) repeat protein